jgi:hypothetical protein
MASLDYRLPHCVNLVIIEVQVTVFYLDIFSNILYAKSDLQIGLKIFTLYDKPKNQLPNRNIIRIRTCPNHSHEAILIWVKAILKHFKECPNGFKFHIIICKTRNHCTPRNQVSLISHAMKYGFCFSPIPTL